MHNKFDIQKAPEFHLERFEKKLTEKEMPTPKKSFAKYYLAIAASLLLLLGIGIGKITSTPGNPNIEMASISPKMQKTQLYYTNILQGELAKIKQMENPDNKKVIADFLNQIQKLENHYLKLTLELKKNGNQKIIFAMISNYQKRIEILKNLMIQLDKINAQKHFSHENIS